MWLVLEDNPLTEYLTEEEQIEQIKKWLKEYSLLIISGILIAILAVSGWRIWQKRQAKILIHASNVYDEMMTLRAQNNTAATYTQAKKLLKHYPNTIYGQFAAFVLARDAVTKQNYQEAEQHLRWIMDHTHLKSLKQIARLRLARILIATKQPQEALKQLDQIDDNQYKGLVDEIRGDAYVTMKDNKKARQFYQKALTELPNAEVIRPLLQIKFDNLATADQLAI